jgi:CENP-B N-terminal DNA-binding domain
MKAGQVAWPSFFVREFWESLIGAKIESLPNYQLLFTLIRQDNFILWLHMYLGTTRMMSISFSRKILTACRSRFFAMCEPPVKSRKTRKCLTIAERLRVIEEYKSGKSENQLAKDYEVSSRVSNLRKTVNRKPFKCFFGWAFAKKTSDLARILIRVKQGASKTGEPLFHTMKTSEQVESGSL